MPGRNLYMGTVILIVLYYFGIIRNIFSTLMEVAPSFPFVDLPWLYSGAINHGAPIPLVARDLHYSL